MDSLGSFWWIVPVFFVFAGFYFLPQGKEARVATAIVWLIALLVTAVMLLR